MEHTPPPPARIIPFLTRTSPALSDFFVPPVFWVATNISIMIISNSPAMIEMFVATETTVLTKIT